MRLSVQVLSILAVSFVPMFWSQANIVIPGGCGSDASGGASDSCVQEVVEPVETDVVVDRSIFLLHPGTSRMIDIWIDNAVHEATLQIAYPLGGRLSAFEIYSPDGIPSRISFHCRERDVALCTAVIGPAAVEALGYGRYALAAANEGEQPIDIAFTVLAIAYEMQEKLHVDGPVRRAITYPQSITLRAIAFGPTSRVRRASMTANVTDPTGARYEANVYPRTHDPDTWTVDVPYSMNGTHRIDIRADATGSDVELSHRVVPGGPRLWDGYSPPDEERFTRVKTVTFVVEGVPSATR